MANKVWIFDLDDTLIDNVHDYAQPILDAASYIIKVLGSKAPHVSAVINMEEEIDKRRVKEVNPDTGKIFGYSMQRFPGTMVELYREICRNAGVPEEYDHEEKLYEIGMGAFDESRYHDNIKPGFGSLIRFLRHESDPMMILTKGDPEVQKKKIAALDNSIDCLGGVAENFSKVEIVETAKTTEKFREMVKDFDGSVSFFAVGNDYYKDIVPAFELGFKGIWIPVETWETMGQTEKIRETMNVRQCRVFTSLMEIVERYQEL